MATEIKISSYLSEEFDEGLSSPPSSPPPCSDLGIFAQQADHKNKIRSFQMKFTYLKEPRKRTRTTPEQLDVLIKFFEKEQTPNAAQRKMLADKTGMPARAVQVWFQNRRAKRRCPSSPSSPSPCPSSSSSSSSSPPSRPKKTSSSSCSLSSASPASLFFTSYCPPDYVPFKHFLSSPTSTPSSPSPVPSSPYLSEGEDSSSSSSSSSSSCSPSSSPLSCPTDSPLFTSDDPQEFLDIEPGTLVLEADGVPPVWESPFDRDQLGLESLLGERLEGIF